MIAQPNRPTRDLDGRWYAALVSGMSPFSFACMLAGEGPARRVHPMAGAVKRLDFLKRGHVNVDLLTIAPRSVRAHPISSGPTRSRTDGASWRSCVAAAWKARTFWSRVSRARASPLRS
jgi:hypothetical protein